MKHPAIGELNTATLTILRMTLIMADAEEWFTAEDVVRPIREVTTERAIRELYKTMILHGLMDEPVNRGGAMMYHLSQRGINILQALLQP